MKFKSKQPCQRFCLIKQRNFCQRAWFNKEQHKRLHNHKNKWLTSNTGNHLKDPISQKLFRANSAEQIKSILNSVRINHEWIDIDGNSDYHKYTVALRKLVDLQEFDECWSLFEQIKSIHHEHSNSNLLCVPIYNTMIYLCVQRRTKYALKQALELYSEMTQIYLLKPDLITFTNLISLCSAVAAWNKADNFWKILIKSSHIKIDLSAYNSMISCYAKSKNFEKAIALFKQLKESDTLKPDSFTYSILISSLGKEKNIKLAEKMFMLALKDWGKYCEIQIYQPLIDAYSQNGDVLSCLKLFNLLLCHQSEFDLNAFCGDYKLDICEGDNALFDCIKRCNEKYEFPLLNAMCFNVLFKGFTRFKQLRFGRDMVRNDEEFNFLQFLLVPNNSWKIIDYLLEVMKAMNVKKTSVTYGILFHLTNYEACFDADEEEKKEGLERAVRIYKDMRKEKNMRIGTDLEMSNLLRTGLSVLSDDLKKKERFVRWWVKQMKEMKLGYSDYARKAIVNAGINIQKL